MRSCSVAAFACELAVDHTHAAAGTQPLLMTPVSPQQAIAQVAHDCASGACHPSFHFTALAGKLMADHGVRVPLNLLRPTYKGHRMLLVHGRESRHVTRPQHTAVNWVYLTTQFTSLSASALPLFVATHC
jgi:hypothetical protein